MSETLHLAQFAAGLRFEDLPRGAVAKAAVLTLQTWGTQLVGSTLPLSRGVHRYAQAQGGAPPHWRGDGSRTASWL